MGWGCEPVAGRVVLPVVPPVSLQRSRVQLLLSRVVTRTRICPLLPPRSTGQDQGQQANIKINKPISRSMGQYQGQQANIKINKPISRSTSQSQDQQANLKVNRSTGQYQGQQANVNVNEAIHVLVNSRLQQHSSHATYMITPPPSWPCHLHECVLAYLQTHLGFSKPIVFVLMTFFM